MLLFNNSGARLIKMITHLIVYALLLKILLFEFNQLMGVFFRTVQYQESFITKQQSLSGLKYLEYLVLENRNPTDLVENQMKLLVIFLKFWHVLFIFTYFTFISIRLVEYGKLSFDAYSSLYVNVTALFYFNLLLLLFASKKLMYFYLLLPTKYMLLQKPVFIISNTAGLIISFIL